MKWKLLIIFFCFLIANALAYQARSEEKLDLQMQSDLIVKLESVLQASNTSQTDDQMLEQRTLSLRLADLYSERARLRTTADNGLGKQKYRHQIAQDQNRALVLYKKNLKKSKNDEKAKIQLQMSHLLLQQNKILSARKLLEEVTASKNTLLPALATRAFIQLGDIHFAQSQFSIAERNYQHAQNHDQDSKQKNYVTLKLAWCAFYAGRTSQAFEWVRNALRKSHQDAAFAEEASHDMATFLAKKGVNKNEIQDLIRLSPGNAVQENLVYLANELDRTAKKSQAILVWAHVDQKNLSPADQVERQIQLAQIQYDLGHSKLVVSEIRKSLSLLQDSRCQHSPECRVQIRNLKMLLTNWGKAEERNPSHSLLESYQMFTATIDDVELASWAGYASMKIRDYEKANDFFSKVIVSPVLRSQQNEPRMQSYFEGALLAKIEAAELAKNNSLLLKNLEAYLALNPHGKKTAEVQYQLAHLRYELGQYEISSPLFRELSLNVSAPMSLRQKAADLYFDTLALQKNDQKIETESLLFAQILTKNSAQFQSLNRKAVLNQSIVVLNSNSSKKTDSSLQLKQQLHKLNQLNLQTWPPAERQKILHNMLMMAKQSQDLDQMQTICQQLLLEKKLSLQEKNHALETLAWTYEVRFQFAQAVTTLEKIRLPKPNSDFLFKLVLLNELAGKKPLTLYRKVLSTSRNNKQKQYASHQLIVSSPVPSAEFQKWNHLLARQPALLESALLYMYEKNPQDLYTRTALKNKLPTQSLGKTLIERSETFKEIAGIQRNIASLRPITGSQLRMKTALKKQLLTIKKTESLIQKAIQQKDTVLQLHGLSLLHQQNLKLANDIITSTLPKQLQDRNAYQAALANKSQYYQNKANAVLVSARKIWMTESFQHELSDLQNLSENTKRPGSRLAKQHLFIITKTAKTLALAKYPNEKFTVQRRNLESKARSLKQELKQNPFDFNSLQELRDLELSLGSGPLVAYLNSRLVDESKMGGRN